MSYTDNETQNLIVNKLTKEQYKTVTDSNTNNEVYHITDDAHYTESEIQNLLGTKQNVLTSSNAGNGISIENGIISNTQISAEWGNIQGDITLQSDLKNALYANNIYENNGLVLIDKQGFNDIKNYYHSTFDLSKFTVVGSPTITDDGIASGFSNSNYITVSLSITASSMTVKNKFTYKKNTNQNTMLYWFDSIALRQYVTTNGDLRIDGNASPSNLYINVPQSIFSENDVIETELIISDTNVVFNVIVNGGTPQQYTSDRVPTISGITLAGIGSSYYQGNNPYTGSIDLKQFSITVDGVPVFNGNKTGLDVIKPDDYNVVGAPTITEDGVASGFTASNYITYNCSSIPVPTKNWECHQIIETWKDDLTTYQMYSSFGNGFYLRASASNFGIESVIDGVRKTITTSISNLEKGTKYEIVYGQKLIDGNYHLFLKYKKVGDEIFNVNEITTEYSKFFNISSYLLYLGVYGTSTPSYPVIDGSIDLNSFKIYVDGNLVYQPCLKIPYTESKTGSKIVPAYARDRVQDMYEQYGQASYYTIDEANKNFTLPMGEIYGMMNSTKTKISNLEDEQPIQNMLLTGDISTNKKGYSQLQNMYHSTFDLSKFEVVGSPTITNDGIASGFESTGTNIIKTQPLSLLNLKEKLTITSKFVYNTDKATSMVWCYNLNFFLSVGTDRIQVAYRKLVEGVASTEYFQIPITLLNISQGDEVYIRTIFTENKVTLIINGETFEKNVDIDLTYIALPSFSFILGQANTNFATLYFQDTIDLKYFSITVDGKEVFNGNKTGIDIIKQNNYTVVGTPTISADEVIYESSSSGNYVQIPLIFADDFELEISWTNRPDKFWWGYLIGGVLEIYHYNGNGVFQVNLRHSGTFSTICNAQYIKGAKYKVRFKKTSDSLVVDVYINNELSVSGTFDLSEIDTLPTSTTLNVCNNNFGTKDPTMFYPVEVDLNNIKVWQYGSLYQPCLKIPYTESKTGSKIVDVAYRDRVQDVYEQYGQAKYFTLDEENKNFTLPIGEIYGMIGQRSLVSSTVTDTSRVDIFSDKTCLVCGSVTTSGIINLPIELANSNYFLTLPASEKTYTSFTTTSTGDYILIGKVV